MNGVTHQMPTRGVTGFNRTGEEHSWVRAPDQYGAIHFHDDDIVDAEWSIDFRFLVPDTMASGVYAARIRQGDQDSENHIVFFVRPARGQKTANLVFLMPDPGIIEIRRAEDGTRSWIAQPGEYYQSFNGEYGGLWRRIGPSAEPYCRHWLCGSRLGLGW